ncbi:MAG: hypothetical protein F6K35_45075 [Okeania sp. SIO2H7]|uniref:hypothetical protein n=1 Tax=unclassified Okeania TaxID=2634635 RepID=UPI0013B72330|nr:MULTISPECIES: hypothetical protein [unclassified Okeania]NEP45999.1 hypothetical protein [Okeania sp. SIO2H7]NEP72922.1 hypothetical protein [Okeania sp. SIO2G5]NEP93732.1 hypothetical protein [Okeania sp. SIO2F5]
MVKLGGVNPPLTPPRKGGEVRRTSSGGERITKINVVMAIEDFFYVQLNGFDITPPRRGREEGRGKMWGEIIQKIQHSFR